MDAKNKIISKKVTETAQFIKECDANGSIPIIIQTRNYGRTQAVRLARETEDITHEEIDPNDIPDGIFNKSE